MTATTRPPTKRQATVYAAIVRHWARYGCGPSVRELMRAANTASPNGVVGNLRALVRKGLIEWDRDGTARGIWPAGLRARIRAATMQLEVARERE